MGCCCSGHAANSSARVCQDAVLQGQRSSAPRYGAVSDGFTQGAEARSAVQGIDKAALVKEVKQALYASKICSYAQGLNIIKAKSAEKQWDVDIGSMARIWKVRDAVPRCSVSDRACLLHTAASASTARDVPHCVPM